MRPFLQVYDRWTLETLTEVEKKEEKAIPVVKWREVSTRQRWREVSTRLEKRGALRREGTLLGRHGCGGPIRNVQKTLETIIKTNTNGADVALAAFTVT